MKKRYLASIVSVCLSQVAMASVINDARSAGSAGVGVASGDYTRSNVNPALLTRFQKNDDAYITFGIGLHEDEFINTMDHVDNFQHHIDDFDQTPSLKNAEHLISDLDELDKKPVNVSLNVDFSTYIPSNTLAIGVSITSEVLVNTKIYIDENDKKTINDSVKQLRNINTNKSSPYSLQSYKDKISNINLYNDNNFSSSLGDKLDSMGLVRGAIISEVKLSMANNVTFPHLGSLSVGITPKFQRIDSFLYADNLNELNIDMDEIKNSSIANNGFNFDLGIHKNIGLVQLGFFGKNLISRSIEASIMVEDKKDKLITETWKLKPTFTAGASITHWGMTLELDVDLIKNKSFVLERPLIKEDKNDKFMMPRQWARIGAEIDIFKQIQLRAGYKKDLANNYDDQFTAGLGISPFDLITLDIAAQYSNQDNVSAALQLGFKF